MKRLQLRDERSCKVFQEIQQANINVQDLLTGLKACSQTGNLEKGRQLHGKAVSFGRDSNIYIASALVNMYAKCGSMVDAQQVFDTINHPNVVSWTTLIMGYATNGKGHTALDLFERMRNEGPKPDAVTFVSALKACTSLVPEGTDGWAECRHRGKEIHDLVVQNSCHLNVYVQSTLIEMYCKCGSMLDAHKVFDSMNQPDVVSWNVLILGYADTCQGITALDLFTKMRNSGPSPNSVTFLAAFKACTSLAVKDSANGWAECRKRGRVIHTLAIESGCSSDIYLQCRLIDLYVKCKCMFDAREVFNGMQNPDVVSWNVLILGYADNGQGLTALNLFTRMKRRGLASNSFTYMAALKACTSLVVEGSCEVEKCRFFGKAVHILALENSYYSDAYVQSTLIDMYAKCGSMVDAQCVFDTMLHPDIVSWTALISGYADNGQGLCALDLFRSMLSEGPVPNSITFQAALKACTSLALRGEWSECRYRGKEIHDLIMRNENNLDIHLQCTLIDMYAKCGNMADARMVFDSVDSPNVVCWNALILGYATNGQGFIALDLFKRMECGRDSVTFLAALKACTSLAVGRFFECRNQAKELHELAVVNGCYSDSYVQNSMIDMYAKAGSMVDAQEVFDSMNHRNVVSWNVLLWGYVTNGKGLNALDVFTRMKYEGPEPDSVTFSAALKACVLVGDLDFGRIIHSQIDRSNHLDMVMVNCLVDFYAKCGSLFEAQRVFDMHPEKRNLITWNTLLVGCSSCGHHEHAFKLFEGIQDAGLQPNEITFICILMCCNHGGLVEKGKECFETMCTKYGIIPTIDHYTCMVDIFGRAKKLDDAMALLQHMPCSPNDVTWMTILGACRRLKNVDIGRLAFRSLAKLNDTDSATYVLMGQIFGSRGMLQEQEMLIERITTQNF